MRCYGAFFITQLISPCSFVHQQNLSTRQPHLENDDIDKCLKMEVINNVTRPTKLWKLFCKGDLGNETCDEYFTLNNLTEIPAVPGLLSGVISGEFSNTNTQQTTVYTSYFTQTSSCTPPFNDNKIKQSQLICFII